MATQAMVTLMQGGAVKMKIVMGCDGYNATKIAKAIKAARTVPSAAAAYELAIQRKCGCRECLVVITPDEMVYKGNKPVSNRYRETFNTPRTSPRSDEFPLDHLFVIDV